MAEWVRLPDVAMVALRASADNAQSLPDVGRSLRRDDDLIVAIGPDEWLILAADADSDALTVRQQAIGAVVLDVSGNRVCFRVRGSDARWFLAAGVSVDLDQMHPGDARSTLLARAPALLIAESDGYLVITRRSFADYLDDWALAANG